MAKKNLSKTIVLIINQLRDFIQSTLYVLRETLLSKNQDTESNLEAGVSTSDHETKIEKLKREFEKKKQERALRQAILEEKKREIANRIDQIEEINPDFLYTPDEQLDEDEENDVDSLSDETLEPTPLQPSPTPETTTHSTSYELNNENYQCPTIDLLEEYSDKQVLSEEDVERQSDTLQLTLDSFAIDAQVIGAIVGPRVTLYKIQPAQGVKVETISQISQNIAMEMQAISLRILTPVPGKKYVGIEIPNPSPVVIGIKQQLQSKTWGDNRFMIPTILGKNISGEDVVLDLAKAPHLLIAGATGSVKSVCLNTMILSLLYRFTPAELRLILVDPKVVEFSVFEKTPHLVVPIITETDKVCAALNWVIKEMEKLYQLLAKVACRNIEAFNNRPPDQNEESLEDGTKVPAKLPFLVVVIDELADIMMTSRTDVEVSLARIAQLSRAVGIHMIVATQRPSVNVITGIIKANFPTRIAFQVPSQIDSRTILDSKGAESLLGRGDMLFSPPGASGLMRIQGPLVSDHEVEAVANFVAMQAEQHFCSEVFQTPTVSEEEEINEQAKLSDQEEELIAQAIEIIRESGRASTSYVQRSLRIGYNRAATIMEILESRGIVGPANGRTPREIL
jgi:S-DNA-T family DNA segregation ATPase FtsK/SpoIIIE